MTLEEFEQERRRRPCLNCGELGITTELNPNNNGLLVRCAHCRSKRPWGSLLFLKQNERRRPKRLPLPDAETLDSVSERFGNRCVVCSAPKDFLVRLGIGRQAHHVAPYAQEGHKGPIVPICTHCHPTATDRQRIYWFYQRVVRQAIEDTTENPDAEQEEVEATRAERS